MHQTEPYPNFSGKALFFVSRRFELRSRRRGFFYACGHLSPARADFRHRRSLAVGSRLRETANSLKVHQTKPYPNFSGKALFFVSRRFELRSRRRGFFYACGHLSPARADFRHRRSLAVGSRLRETANSLKVHQNRDIRTSPMREKPIYRFLFLFAAFVRVPVFFGIIGENQV